MLRKPMRVLLTKIQARELNLPEDHEYVRAAFYLGISYMVIQNRVRHRAYAEERRDTLETAQLLGMKDDDKIIY